MRERLCTDAQWSYLQRLLREAFAHLYKGPTFNLDVHHQPTYYTSAAASSHIKQLLVAKEKGWK